MREISKIIEQIQYINEHRDSLRPVDIELLIRDFTDLKNNFDSISVRDEYPLRFWSNNLKELFSFTSVWKDHPLLSKCFVNCENMLAITDLFLDKPQKAIKKHGPVPEIKKSISIALQLLIDSLEDVLKVLKKKVAVRQAARA